MWKEYSNNGDTAVDVACPKGKIGELKGDCWLQVNDCAQELALAGTFPALPAAL